MVERFMEALSWLTVLPVRVAQPRGLGVCAPAFPAVGLVVGGLAALAGYLAGGHSSLVGGVAAAGVWIGLTGAMHLDGVADLADGLAAGHATPERRRAVMKDPHTGALGAAAVAFAVASRIALLAAVVVQGKWWAIPLAAAWARLGGWGWGVYLEPTSSEGMGATLHREAPRRPLGWWGCLLLVLSFPLAPPLAVAPLVLIAWGVWLSRTLGGQSGDTLGAGIEVVEICLLAVVAGSGL